MPEALLDVNRLLTADEVSQIASLTRESVWYYTRIGIIKAIKIGRKYRYSPVAIREFIENGGRAIA